MVVYGEEEWRFHGLGLALACILLLVAALKFSLWVRRRPTLRSIAILVLGDVGRSPRMMYHAESFAKFGFRTYLIGYKGSKLPPSLASLPRIHLRYLPEPPTALARAPFVVSAPVKIAHQALSILYTLMCSMAYPPEFIMVQNPPSIPTLALVWLVGRMRGSKVIIDWHNFGYTILALKLGGAHPFVRVAKWFEQIFGRSAYAHLFVTQAMRDHVVNEWRIIGQKAVLHDRPPAHFHRCLPPEIHELFLRLGPSLTDPTLKGFLPVPSTPYTTQFTTTTWASSHGTQSSCEINMPKLRNDRVALLVSSTSWTPDEDFGILLEALAIYEERAQRVNGDSLSHTTGKLPRIWMVITGKGPLKTRYMLKVARLQEKWDFVRCTSLWLEAEDYPLLLGSADLGICLHSSSSGLDLPMKVVDMFGCRLPVCALDFKCLPELVQDGQNGLVFKNSTQLAGQLEDLLMSFPHSPKLDTLRSHFVQAAARARPVHPRQHVEGAAWEWCSWAENWDRVVKPLVSRDVQRFE